jgi:hypothetical protein
MAWRSLSRTVGTICCSHEEINNQLETLQQKLSLWRNLHLTLEHLPLRMCQQPMQSSKLGKTSRKVVDPKAFTIEQRQQAKYNCQSSQGITLRSNNQ